MPHRDSTRPPSGVTRSSRPTRRGIAPLEPDPIASEPEPAFSSRPTRRDLSTDGIANDISRARGEFSIRAVHGIPADTVSGEITLDSTERGRKRRRTNSQPPPDEVYLAAATPHEITVIVKEQAITLERHNALALASIIVTAFD